MINLTDLPHAITLHRVFGPKEAAAFLGVTVAQLGRMRREGVLPPPLHYSQRRYGWSVGTLLMYLDLIEMRNSGYVIRPRTDSNYFQESENSDADVFRHMKDDQDWRQMDREMERDWQEEMSLERKKLESIRPTQ